MRSDPKTPVSKATEYPAQDETPEVEGHAATSKHLVEPATTDDERDSGQAEEVEGHSFRTGTAEQPSDAPEVAGHSACSGRMVALPESDERDTEQAEVEGHVYRYKAVEQPSDDPETEEDVKGHSARGKA